TFGEVFKTCKDCSLIGLTDNHLPTSDPQSAAFFPFISRLRRPAHLARAPPL
ncbi:hypothetical protein FRC15_006261, partial [Serendipita sp. 397]